MSDYRIPLPQPVPAKQAGELAQRIFFVAEQITDFSFGWADDHVSEVVLTTSGPVAAEELAAKLHHVVAEEVLPQRISSPKVVWRSPVTAAPVKEVFDDLAALGEVAELGEGQFCLGPLVTGFMSYLDNRLSELVAERFGAREYRYPTLISTATMRRCNYFASFPQFLMLVTRLHADLDNYREFLRDTAHQESLAGKLLDYCKDVSYCLPPTMCYHTYRHLQDARLPAENLVVTARGKSFRHESRYWKSLERLWDFTIREVVFLGTRDRVLDQRSQMMDLVTELVTELDLAGHCEAANDPFFGHLDSAQRAWSQRMLEAKYELRLPVAADRTIAAASFNFHERFFGSSFNIGAAEDGEPVFTACAGVGLERFTYAFLCRHGLDPVRRALPARSALPV